MFKPSTVKAWMQVNLEEHEDRRTGEINTTSLAEAAAAHFDMDHDGGPLDDDLHWIWDAAVGCRCGSLMRDLHRLYREEATKARKEVTDRLAIVTARLNQVYWRLLHAAAKGETGARSEAIVIYRDLFEATLSEATKAVDFRIEEKKRLAAQYGPDKHNVRR